MPAIEPTTPPIGQAAKPQPAFDPSLFAELVQSAMGEAAQIAPAEGEPERPLPPGLAVATDHGATPVAKGITGQLPPSVNAKAPAENANEHAIAQHVVPETPAPPASAQTPRPVSAVPAEAVKDDAKDTSEPVTPTDPAPKPAQFSDTSLPQPIAVATADPPGARVAAAAASTPSTIPKLEEDVATKDVEARKSPAQPASRNAAPEKPTNDADIPTPPAPARIEHADVDVPAPAPASSAIAAPIEHAAAKPLAALPTRAAEQASVVTYTPTPRFAEDVGIAIARHAKGLGDAGDITLRIEPPSLGRIEVKLKFDDGGQIQALISADQPRVLEQLRQAGADLHRGLVDASQRSDIAPPRFEGQNTTSAGFAGTGGQPGQHPPGGGHRHGQQQASHRWQQHLANDAQPFEVIASAAGRVNLVA